MNRSDVTMYNTSSTMTSYLANVSHSGYVAYNDNDNTTTSLSRNNSHMKDDILLNMTGSLNVTTLLKSASESIKDSITRHVYQATATTATTTTTTFTPPPYTPHHSTETTAASFIVPPHFHENLLDAAAGVVDVSSPASSSSISHSHVAAVTVLSALSALVLVLALWLYCRRPYKQFLSPSHSSYDYIYKPLTGAGGIDEEYENTFVGVTVPILHDNSKL